MAKKTVGRSINILIEYGILIKVSHGLYCLKYPGVFTPLQEREKQESLRLKNKKQESLRLNEIVQAPVVTDIRDSIGQKLSDTHERVTNDVMVNNDVNESVINDVMEGSRVTESVTNDVIEINENVTNDPMKEKRTIII
jgi:nitrogen regulatory protein PII-like uncharacterized protein